MNKFSSVFGQILQIFSKAEFYKAVKELKAEKGAKGITRARGGKKGLPQRP